MGDYFLPFCCSFSAIFAAGKGGTFTFFALFAAGSLSEYGTQKYFSAHIVIVTNFYLVVSYEAENSLCFIIFIVNNLLVLCAV